MARDIVLNVKANDLASKKLKEIRHNVSELNVSVRLSEATNLQFADSFRLLGDEAGAIGEQLDMVVRGVKQAREAYDTASKAVQGFGIAAKAAMGVAALAITAAIGLINTFSQRMKDAQARAKELRDEVEGIRQKERDKLRDQIESLDVMEREAAILKALEDSRKEQVAAERERMSIQNEAQREHQRYWESNRAEMIPYDMLAEWWSEDRKQRIEAARERTRAIQEERARLFDMLNEARAERQKAIEEEKKARIEAERAAREEQQRQVDERYKAFQEAQRKEAEERRRQEERAAKEARQREEQMMRERKKRRLEAIREEIRRQREAISSVRGSGSGGDLGATISALESRFLTRTGVSQDREQILIAENRAANEKLERMNARLEKLQKSAEAIANNTGEQRVTEVQI